MAPTRVALLVAVVAALAAGQPPSSWTCPGSQVEIAVARGGVTRQQRLCAHAGALYLPLGRRATSTPATCDEARALALPNVGCFLIGGTTLTYFAAVALVIRGASVFINSIDRTHASVVGAITTGAWSGYLANFGSAGACGSGGSPAWGSMDLRDTAFALNTSLELNFRATGHHPYNNGVVYSHGDQRADFTADGHCGGTVWGNPSWTGGVDHPDDALLPIVGIVVTSSPTPTPTPSASSTPPTDSPSSSATASSTPAWTCPGSQVDVTVERGGLSRQQRLCAHAGALYLPLGRRATSTPATCDEARAQALPNVGCHKVYGERLAYFYAVALVIRGGVSFINITDRTHATITGTSGHIPFFGEASACHGGAPGTPAWGSMDLRDTAFALNTSLELNFRVSGAGPYNNELMYSHGDQRADYTADGSCGNTAFGNHYTGEVNHPDDALLPIVGSVVPPSPTPTPTPSASSTPLTDSPSSSATATMTSTHSASDTGSSLPTPSMTPPSITPNAALLDIRTRCAVALQIGCASAGTCNLPVPPFSRVAGYWGCAMNKGEFYDRQQQLVWQSAQRWGGGLFEVTCGASYITAYEGTFNAEFTIGAIRFYCADGRNTTIVTTSAYSGVPLSPDGVLGCRSGQSFDFLVCEPPVSFSATSSSLPSQSATPSSTPVADCSGRFFRTLRYTDLDGDVISVHGGLSEHECQVRCCRAGSACSAYVLGLVTNECFLLANSTSYNAAHYFHAGVRARDGEVGGGGS